jgi:hypothetical protein
VVDKSSLKRLIFFERFGQIMQDTSLLSSLLGENYYDIYLIEHPTYN